MSIDVGSIFGSPTTPTTPPTTTDPTANSTLTSQDFLNLLVAQLKNQDPSNPMDSTQLMTQTTQLSEMQQLSDMATTSQQAFGLQMRMAAASLVGQQVTYTDTAGKAASGTVSSVSYAGSVPTVAVGSDVVALDSVSAVTAPAPTTPTPPAPTSQA
jgi:flagellar basal-body rod modification protein FlgD